MAACYNNTIPSSLLNATYGPSAFEAGKYGNKFDIYANTYPSTFDRTFAGVPTTFDRMMPTTFAGVPTPFGRSTVVPPTTFGLPTPFGVESRPCASVCPGINFPVCCPISYERVAPLRAGAFPSTFEGRFGYPSTWAELARCYPSTWERTAFPSTWGYPSWALNERLPSTWGYENIMPSTWNNMWSTIPSNTFVNSTYCNVAFRPSHPVEFYSLTNPIRICDREGNRMLWLCYELKGYKPEEITCTFNKAERAVIVEAAHEIKEGKEHHILRKFYRKFVLPESLAKVDLSKIELKSCLNNEGFLTIECVLPKMTAEEIAKCPVLSKVNEIPFYGAEAARRYFNGANPADVANCVRPVTVKTA